MDISILEFTFYRKLLAESYKFYYYLEIMKILLLSFLLLPLFFIYVSAEVTPILVNGSQFYPIGTYTSRSIIERTPELAKNGFNTVLTYLSFSNIEETLKQLDFFHSHGLKVIVNYSTLTLKGKDKLVISHIRGIKHHKSILGYYIADEPDGTWHKHPDYSKKNTLKSFIHKRLTSLKNAIRQPDCDNNPEHYIMMCVAWQKNYDDFADIYDINLADNYQPITAKIEFGVNKKWESPRVISTDARRAVDVARQKNRNCMFVSHGCDEIAGVLEKSRRPPTKKEYLYSTFSPITRHVKGSMHWCAYRMSNNYAHEVVYPVTRILHKLQPYLEGPYQNEALTGIMRYKLVSGKWKGPIKNSNIFSVHSTPYISKVLYRHKNDHKQYVLIIVNNYKKSQKFELRLSDFSHIPPKLDNILDKNPPITLEGEHSDVLINVLTPFDVHIYMIELE